MNPEKTKTKKLSRGAKIAIFLGGALAAYTVIGFFVVPAVVKSQMLKRLPLMLKRPVAVAEVKVNPFALSADINGFAVNETNGTPFAGWDQFHARLNFSSFISRGWSVGEISLVHPFAHLARQENGRLNFDDILAALAASPTPAHAPAAKTALPQLNIGSLTIDKAEIAVDDLVPAKPVHTRILPLRVKLDHLSTAGAAHNPYEITAESDSQETFNWSGAFTLDPPQVTGSFVIQQVDLKDSPYLAQFAKAEVTDGRLNVKADYTAGLGPNGPDASLQKCEVLLKSFALKSDSTGETVVSIPALSVTLTEADLGKRLLHLASIKSSDGSLLVRRESDGRLNLLALLKTNSIAPPSKSAATSSQPPWSASVDEISFTNYSLNAEDKLPPQPAKLTVDQIFFQAKGFSTASNAPLDLDLAVRLGGSGQFATHGVVHLQPPSAELSLNLAGFDLRPLQPYVQQQVQLAITSGQFNLQGQAAYNSGHGAPLATFSGDLSLTNFATADLLRFKDLVKLNSLAVTGIKFAFQPNQLEVGEVALRGLSTSVIVDANNKINLLAVLPPKPVSASNAPPAASAALDFPVALAKLTIDNASFHLSDQSIEPNCLFDVQELDGVLTGLSSRPDSRATVDLHGKVDDVSPFSVVGSANPLARDLTVDVTIDCKNVNLTPFTPYMEKFGGYPLQRGKLLVDLRHNIAHGSLAASNHVVVAGLTLGAKNHSTNATHLPVKLGIALLKDRQGNIALDVPLTGRLNDPNFRLRPIIQQVLENILSKAATAPFTMLGKLFGSGEELSYVDFQPGQSAIPAAEQPKLDKLSRALYERPGLQLEISGASDPLSDSPALARLKLDDQIRSLLAQELTAAGNPPDTVQSVNVDPANYVRFLQTLYVRTFTNAPDLSVESNTIATVAAAANSPAPVAASLPPPPPAPAFRAVHRMPLKGAVLLVQRTSAGTAMKEPASRPLATAPRVPASALAASGNQAVAAPPAAAPGNQLTQEQMEAALLAQIQITPNDLRALMQARARSVQAALAASGKVEGERLFIIAPQPVALNAKGQSRANLALQ